MSEMRNTFFDVLAIVLGVAFVIGLELTMPSIKKGFYCGDPSISHKFTGDTVNLPLMILTIVSPLFVLPIGEFIASRHRRKFNKKPTVSAWKSSSFYMKGFAFGFILHLGVLTMTRTFVGEPRPHFMDTCKPDAAVNCTVGEYIEDYVCTATGFAVTAFTQSSRSFPSGHASVSFYVVLFIIWYLKRKMSKLNLKYSHHIVYMILTIWAIFCSVSRINDHRHHFWDVAVGSVYGILTAIYTCLYLCNNFRMKTDDIIKNLPEFVTIEVNQKI